MRSSAVRRYGLALLCVVLALLLRYLLDPFVGGRVPFSTFFVATIFSAWYCRLGPALIALMLGGVLASYFFIEPRGSLSLHQSQDGISVVVYLITGLATILLL